MTTMIEVEITAGADSDDSQETVTLSVDYYLSLLAAKRELKQLKARGTGPVPTQGYDPGLADAAEYLSTDHPDLLDYSGMSLSQAADMYPDLIDYDVYERDC